LCHLTSKSPCEVCVARSSHTVLGVWKPSNSLCSHTTSACTLCDVLQAGQHRVCLAQRSVEAYNLIKVREWLCWCIVSVRQID
jgi:hypothetical protein